MYIQYIDIVSSKAYNYVPRVATVSPLQVLQDGNPVEYIIYLLAQHILVYAVLCRPTSYIN